MTELPFKFDEIGIWSELKLDIIEQYGAAYTKAFARTPKLKKYYIDAFSGAGKHVAKKTKAQVEGSPARALKVRPPFDGYCFIDLDGKKTDFLRATCGDRQDVDIHTGDANEYLTKTVLPKIQYEKFTRALCLLDRYGLDLNGGLSCKPGNLRPLICSPTFRSWISTGTRSGTTLKKCRKTASSA